MFCSIPFHSIPFQSMFYPMPQYWHTITIYSCNVLHNTFYDSYPTYLYCFKQYHKQKDDIRYRLCCQKQYAACCIQRLPTMYAAAKYLDEPYILVSHNLVNFAKMASLISNV